MSHQTALVLTVGLTVLAILLGLTRPGAPARRRLKRLTTPAVHESAMYESAGSGRRWGARIGVVLVAIGLLVGSDLLFGVRGLAFGAAGLMVTGTVTLLVRRRGRRTEALANRTAVAQACSILAAQVRIGQVPSEALASAAADCSVLVPARETVAIGGDPVDCWRAQARTPGLAGLSDLARAWRLSITTGAELAAALEEVAEALAADQALSLVISSEAAAPRATGKIMAVLPIVGIGLGYMMGGDPVAFLIGTPIGWTCVFLGSFSACAGVVWMEKIADRATAEA